MNSIEPKPLLLAAAIVFFPSLVLLAETIRVPDDYPTISAAMAAACSGDKILVGLGEYSESVVMAPGVSLIGAGPQMTLINGGTEPAVVCADGCAVAELRLISSSTIATLFASDASITVPGNEVSGRGNGIYCISGSLVAVGNSLHDNLASGVLSVRSVVQIEQNLAYFNDIDGIRCVGCGAEIIGNTAIWNGHVGISARDGTEANVEGNVCLENHHSGLYISDSSGAFVSNSLNDNCQFGFFAVNSTHVRFKGNEVVGNREQGIRFLSSTGSIDGNTVILNKWAGIWIMDDSVATVRGNATYRNYGTGILIEGGSNAVVRNNYHLRNYASGIGVTSSSWADIASETILKNRYDGVYCQDAHDVSVSCCLVSGSHLAALSANASNVSATNNVFAEAFLHGIVSRESSAQVLNNVFYSMPNACVFCENFREHLVSNNIFCSARHALFAPDYGASSALEISYNDTWDMVSLPYATGYGSQAFLPFPGTGLISEDPSFADPDSCDFHLLPGSLCIDAGSPEAGMNDPDGSVNDMGAYGGPDAGPIGAAPFVRPYLSRYDHDVTDNVTLSVSIENVGEEALVDLYLLVRFDGMEFYFPDWSSEPITFAFTLPYGFSTDIELLSVEASLLPLGRYEVIAGALDHDTSEPVGEGGYAVFRIVRQRVLPPAPDELGSETGLAAACLTRGFE